MRLISQKATHLDTIRRNVWPPMLMKKFFFSRQTLFFFTKERLSDYTIKEKKKKTKHSPQTSQRKHNGFQHSNIQNNAPPMLSHLRGNLKDILPRITQKYMLSFFYFIFFSTCFLYVSREDAAQQFPKIYIMIIR